MNIMTMLIAATCHSGNAALVPHPHVGDTLPNAVVFTDAYTAEGYPEIAMTLSGTLTFVVTSARSDSLAFNVREHSYGQGGRRSSVTLRDGRRTRCVDGACALYTDASGVLYNPYMWGDAPHDVCDGMTWTVVLPKPWGMGPPGSQTVHVIHVDTAAHMVVLRRDGTGEGSAAHDDGHLTLTKDSVSTRFDVTPGAARWSGYTIIRDGAVVADEILVERSLVLTAPGRAPIRATEHQYVVYNTIAPLD